MDTKEAKEVLKGFYEKSALPIVSTALETLFPELKESEDERIRKELIDAVQGLWDNDALPMPLSVKRKDAWIAWLEKQGEPVEINPTEFDTRLQALIGKFDSLPKEELIGSLSFWLNVVHNDGTYKEEKQGEKPQGEDEQIMKEIAEFIYISPFKPKDLKKKEKWLTWFNKQGKKLQGNFY